MRGYLSVEAAAGQVPVRERTGVYRDPDRGEAVVAETDGNVVPLGVADVTVSRRGASGVPVVLLPQDERIEIRNNGNSNGVTVVSGGETTDVPEGRVESVTTDATISIGYRTDLQLQIERDARLEQNVVHRGEGDVVMGDMTDRSTTVGDDNVMNRSEIGDSTPDSDGDERTTSASKREGSATSNPDRSRTRNRHPTKTTDRSPGSDPESRRQGPEPTSETGGAGAGGRGSSERVCPDCGTETRPTDSYCSGCGRELGGDEGGGDTQKFCQRHERAYRGDTCPECARER
jgi:hypothetical protein